MEKVKQKLSTSVKSTLVLLIFSLVWVSIDYMALKSIYDNKITDFSFEWLIISISLIPFLLFHTSALITIYYIWILNRKMKKAEKKEKKEGLNYKETESGEDRKSSTNSNL